ncbi:fimbrillin family protein [Bacteroides hominis]|uniref:fimbrillin family protein n=1 Tax=Bacteroides TaxID=816 RepID=UPI0029499DC7|nr:MULTISPECIES: fimbrillin family protein [Bacteroides]MDV6173499.1 fimbrillin family protein [Bacteroides hominis (ex Liu et al. 2022)]
MDTNKKYILPRTIILAACSLLLAGGCDNNVYDGMERDTPAKEVPLNFNASIEKTEVVQSRSITSTTDFTGDSYSFGMSITKNENGNEIFIGSSDMTAKMERSGSSVPWNWSFINNSDNSEVTPTGPEGKALKVIAYYPRISSNTQSAYTNGIPFDFSSKTDLKQTDLLYNTSTVYPFDPSNEPVVTIPLRFRHAYTWIVLNIRKYMNNDAACKLSSVSLDNLGGDWIKNKGAIDPATGLAKDGATAGPIGVTLTPAVALSTTDVTYEFLVPSFMDAKVGDGDIVLVLMVDGVNETFTLGKSYLNKSEDGKLFGLRQGYKNTYNLVYNNSALSMNIQNWTSEVINGDFGGEIADPPTSDYMWVGLEKKFQVTNWPQGTWPNGQWSDYPPIPEYYNPGKHPYKSYFTTVAYGGNGDYVPVNPPDPASLPTDGMTVSDDINLYAAGKEKVCKEIHVTKNDVSTLSVPWEDANGKLVAKELCRQYTGGGFHDWRLPRASELRALFLIVAANGNTYNGLNFSSIENDKKMYWTGTEVNENEAWSAMCSGYFNPFIVDKGLVLSPQDKKKTAFVRCVRDVK